MKMKNLRSFNQTITETFSLVDGITKTIKSNLIGLCSDVDRYIRLSTGVDIYHEMNDKSFSKIIKCMYKFHELSLEQFNRLLFTFISIRDISAHLYLNRKIYLDDDLREFISSKGIHRYALEKSKELTIYGAFCLVFLFSQRFQFHTFITSVIRHDVFKEIEKTSMPTFQSSFRLNVDRLIGNGKPIHPSGNVPFPPDCFTFFVQQANESITELFFNLEYFSINKKTSSDHVPTFKQYLEKYPFLRIDADLMESIVWLRNCWLHGYHLFDELDEFQRVETFDLDTFFDILIEIKNVFENTRYSQIIDNINKCAERLIDFFTLSFIEVSYKLLDKRLFEEQKAENRCAKSVNLDTRLFIPDITHYDKMFKLLKDGAVKWYLTSSKFKDGQARIVKSDKLVVYEITSKNNLVINDVLVEVKDIAVAKLDLEDDKQVKINGRVLSEYKKVFDSSYSFIDVYNINVDDFECL